jgi:hypothetical protein
MGLHLTERKLQSGGKSSWSSAKVKIPGRLQLRADAMPQIGARRLFLHGANAGVQRIREGHQNFGIALMILV